MGWSVNSTNDSAISVFEITFSLLLQSEGKYTTSSQDRTHQNPTTRTDGFHAEAQESTYFYIEDKQVSDTTKNVTIAKNVAIVTFFIVSQVPV